MVTIMRMRCAILTIAYYICALCWPAPPLSLSFFRLPLSLRSLGGKGSTVIAPRAQAYPRHPKKPMIKTLKPPIFEAFAPYKKAQHSFEEVVFCFRNITRSSSSP